MGATIIQNDIDIFDAANVTNDDIAAIDEFDIDVRSKKLGTQLVGTIRYITATTESHFNPPATESPADWLSREDFWATTGSLISKFDIVFIDAGDIHTIIRRKVDTMENVVLINERLENQNTQPQLSEIPTIGISTIFPLNDDYSYKHYLKLSKLQENAWVNWWINKFKRSEKIREDYRERLIQRICDLRDWAIEDKTLISADSLSNFYKFINLYPSIGYPSLVLTPTGTFSSLWKENENQKLSIEFLPNNEVLYTVFAPDPRGTSIIRTSGVIATQRVLEHLNDLKIKEWLDQYAIK